MNKRTRGRRLLAIVATIVLTLVGSVVFSEPASATSLGDMLSPLGTGVSTCVYQGYDSGTHAVASTSEYALDLVDGAHCTSTTVAAGLSVYAPLSGKVAYWEAGHGNLCINTADGRSYTLTHIDASVTSGDITAGTVMGTIAAAQSDPNTAPRNNGVAHLHFQIWSTKGCYNASVIPFDGADYARICGAPDMTASSTGTYSNGTWSSTVFTGDTCGTPVVDSDGDGTYDPYDALPNVRGIITNRGAPILPSRLSGDFDGDGNQDIAIFVNYGVSDLHVKLFIFKGNGSGGFGWPQVMWDSGPGVWDWRLLKPVVGDFNGDGKSDIAVLHDAGGSRTDIYLFKGTSASTFVWPTIVWDSGPNVWDWRLLTPVPGNFSGDAYDDIAVLYDAGGVGGSQTEIFTLYGTTAATWTWPGTPWNSGVGAMSWASSRPVSGDFNGDGYDDIAVFLDMGTNRVRILMFYWNPSISGFNWPQVAWDSGNNVWDWRSVRPVAGDFNGDGKDDITVVYNAGTNWTQYYTFCGYTSGSPTPTFAWPLKTWDSGAGNLDWNVSLPVTGKFNSGSTTDMALVEGYSGSQTKILFSPSTGSAFSWPSSTSPLGWDSGLGNLDWGLLLTG